MIKNYTFTDIQEEGYDGLDSARDTEAEVETAIRWRFGLYPIRCLITMQSNDVMMAKRLFVT